MEEKYKELLKPDQTPIPVAETKEDGAVIVLLAGDGRQIAVFIDGKPMYYRFWQNGIEASV